jgi:hypothetical protein
MRPALGTVVVIGVAGQVGRAVRAGLRGLAARVVPADLVEVTDPGRAGRPESAPWHHGYNESGV